MGEPAVPTPDERKATLELARSIVEAVRNDEPGPLEVPDQLISAVRVRALWGSEVLKLNAWVEKIDLAAFRLAQDLVELRRAYELVCAEHEIDFEKPFREWMKIFEEERRG